MKKFLAGALLLLSASFSFAAVNLNTASQSELEAIKGIGPKKAQAIIEYRTKNGGFKQVDDLQNVRGIGHGKTFDKLKGEFVLNGQSTSTVVERKTVSKSGIVKGNVNPAFQQPGNVVVKKGFNNPLQQGAKPAVSSTNTSTTTTSTTK